MPEEVAALQPIRKQDAILIRFDHDPAPGWSANEVANRVRGFLADLDDDCIGHGIIEHLNPEVDAIKHIVIEVEKA